MGAQTGRSRNTEKARKQAITIPGVTNIFRFNKLANGNTTVGERDEQERHDDRVASLLLIPASP